MTFLKKGKTNWKYILIIVILAFLVGGGILWLAPQYEIPGQLTEIKKLRRKTDIAAWEVYRDETLKYEFRYPPNWIEPSRAEGDTSFVIGYLFKDGNGTYWITHGYISQAQLSVMGITYCGAHPDDTSRCESIKIGGIVSIVDWGIASAWVPHPSGGIVTFELQPVVHERRGGFYQILSTFKFLE